MTPRASSWLRGTKGSMREEWRGNPRLEEIMCGAWSFLFCSWWCLLFYFIRTFCLGIKSPRQKNAASRTCHITPAFLSGHSAGVQIKKFSAKASHKPTGRRTISKIDCELSKLCYKYERRPGPMAGARWKERWSIIGSCPDDTIGIGSFCVKTKGTRKFNGVWGINRSMSICKLELLKESNAKT